MHRTDTPAAPPPEWETFRQQLRQPDPEGRIDRWVVHVDGALIAEGLLVLPLVDNVHLAQLGIRVAPAHHRRGIGRALLDQLTAQAAAEQRSVLVAASHRPIAGPVGAGPGGAFLTAAGFKPELELVQRRLALTAVPSPTCTLDSDKSTWTNPRSTEMRSDQGDPVAGLARTPLCRLPPRLGEQMQLKRVVISAAVVASVGAVTAVTVPAVADTDQRNTPRSAVQAPADGAADDARVSDEPAMAPPELSAELAPELLAALQRDLDLTEEEVRARLRTEAWASQTSTALRDELGDRYAGAWLNEGAEDLMIGVTDEAAAAAVRAAGGEPKLVGRNLQQLDTVRQTLDAQPPGTDAAIAGWYVDVAENTVVILAAAEAEEAAWGYVADRGLPREAVQVLASTEAPTLFNDVRGGDAYFINNSARCSVGFSVVGGFVTAGHCALGGTTTTGFNGVAQGEFVAASFPGVGVGGPDDWGVVAVNDDWIPQPVVNDFEGGELPVAGADEAPVGASICKYGSTTGVSCGVVQAKDATVNYPEGTVTGMTRTNVCAEPGDSGGAWLSGDQAQGITSGGSGDCTSGGVTFFQPLLEVLDINQLTLVTTTGEPVEPPPPADDGEQAPADPPAVACDAADHTFQGQLNQQQRVQVQPNGRAYRALSDGTHSVCLTGPDGADFDLVLQQWTGEQWQTVASATESGAAEQLVFTGAAGFYRIAVVAQQGAGPYQVGLSFEAS